MGGNKRDRNDVLISKRVRLSIVRVVKVFKNLLSRVKRADITHLGSDSTLLFFSFHFGLPPRSKPILLWFSFRFYFIYLFFLIEGEK